MKNRGRSPAARAKDAHKSGTGGSSSGRSNSDLEADSALVLPSTNPSGGLGALATATSTLAAATAEEVLTVTAMSNVSPNRHHMSATLPANLDPDNSSLGNSIFYDDPDSLAALMTTPSDPAQTQRAIEHYQTKIQKTKEQIKEVQTSLDENVNEYLKLSANATDNVQQQRIKQVFEKKNQKSAQSITQLQRKLDEYSKKVRDLEKHGLQKQPKMRDIGQGLKNVGGNIRDGISGAMSKPKEFANFVMGGHKKFGSADNLSSLADEGGSSGSVNTSGGGHKSHHNKRGDHKDKSSTTGGKASSSFPREGSAGGGSLLSKQSSYEDRRKCLSEDGGLRHRSERESSAASSSSIPKQNPKQTRSQSSQQQQPSKDEATGKQIAPPTVTPNVLVTSSPQRPLPDDDTEWNAVVQELTLHKEEVDRLREEMDELRQQFKQEVETLTYQLREERDLYSRLEEQINDLTELHQHEIENIKSGINDMEEKVQYQSEERLLDIKEHLQTLETKVTSMEHQQVQQQYLNIEGLDSTDARAIMMKLLNAVITFVHVILFFIGTFMSFAKPFLKTTPRLLSTTVLVIVSVCAYHQQETLMALFLKLKSASAAKKS